MRSEWSQKLRRYSAPVIPATALIYALFAGLRTVGDLDLGWQLATGRWIVQHRAIPTTDILSYTAAGREWIYPALSQVILYCSYVLGGYSLLSWLGAAVCVGTVALLLDGSPISKFLAVLAVPLIAAHTVPRAEMFTTALFAAFVSILWRYHRTGCQRLWILPLLMCLWVNLHLGFIAGLAMCGAYVFLELGDALLGNNRASALHRLRSAAPWLFATFLATIANPWGLRVFASMGRQADILRIHNLWITEWMSTPVTLSRLLQALAWRDPRSALWWLIASALLAMLIAAFQRRVIPVLLLGASVYLCLHSIRLEASFAAIVGVIGGSILADASQIGWLGRNLERLREGILRSRSVAIPAAVLAVVVFAGIRIGDLVSNRYYLQTPDQVSLFGTGVASWYPEDAAAFLLREHLPGNIYNEYNLGGFVTWRLAPTYPDYIDGRAVPFGGKLFFRSMELLQESLDSQKWQEEANGRGINTVVVSLDHAYGGGARALGAFCNSESWQAVYLDTRAAIFVRSRPETERQVNALHIDCDKVRFDAPPSFSGARGDSERYNYYLNSGGILLALRRNSEAQHQLELAEHIFYASSDLHYLKAGALFFSGLMADAERELRISLEVEPTDQASLALAGLYSQQGRYGEAETVLEKAIELSNRPYQLFLELGLVKVGMGEPEQASNWFDQAEKGSPFVDEGAPLGADFYSRLSEGRERMAELYETRGLHWEALRAHEQAAKGLNR